MSQQKYYKVIGRNRGNYPYKLGLNTLAENGEEFNPEPKCDAGGLYFCTIENIFSWMKYGDKVCELTIPEDAQVVAAEGKFKADKIFIERIFPFDIKVLVELGADMHIEFEFPLRHAVGTGRLDMVKQLVELGADIHLGDEWVLCLAAERGHRDIVEYLLELGALIHADYDAALRQAGRGGHLDVVKCLVEHGADINACYGYTLGNAALNGYLDIVKYLVEKGADVHAKDNYALRCAKEWNRIDVVEYLESLL